MIFLYLINITTLQDFMRILSAILSFEFGIHLKTVRPFDDSNCYLFKMTFKQAYLRILLTSPLLC